jgi:hypothetical protein
MDFLDWYSHRHRYKLASELSTGRQGSEQKVSLTSRRPSSSNPGMSLSVNQLLTDFYRAGDRRIILIAMRFEGDK